MEKITFCTVLAMWALTVTWGYAQITESETNIEMLKASRDEVIDQEKEALKIEIENLTQRLENNTITQQEYEKLKFESAEKHALNIENRLAIIDNRVALLERNGTDSSFVFRINMHNEIDNMIYLGKKNKNRKYDRRTISSLFIAVGFNDAISKDNSWGNTEISAGRSGFLELGLSWKTRVFKNSNLLRIKYGLAFQWNRLQPRDNNYFVENGSITGLEEFPFELDAKELRITNLVVPLHLEIGSSKKIEKETYFRYSTQSQFKLGMGGYAGFNIGTMQKLKYMEEGERVKEKIKRDYNTTDFVYGVSGYIGLGSLSLYAKYDLSPIFKNQVVDQNNLSFGIRVDLD